jgi:hypothetical protein
LVSRVKRRIPIRIVRFCRSTELAFLLVTWDGDDVRAFEHRLVARTGFDLQLPWHLALADEERASVIKWAHDREGALVEVHVHHDGDPVALSPSDRAGLNEFVPHVWWRLRHQPYMDLVFGESTFDGLVWRVGPGVPESLEALIVDGRITRMPTGRSLVRCR